MSATDRLSVVMASAGPMRVAIPADLVAGFDLDPAAALRLDLAELLFVPSGPGRRRLRIVADPAWDLVVDDAGLLELRSEALEPVPRLIEGLGRRGLLGLAPLGEEGLFAWVLDPNRLRASG